MFNLYVLELNNFETLLMKQIIPRGSTCLSHAIVSVHVTANNQEKVTKGIESENSHTK